MTGRQLIDVTQARRSKKNRITVRNQLCRQWAIGKRTLLRRALAHPDAEIDLREGIDHITAAALGLMLIPISPDKRRWAWTHPQGDARMERLILGLEEPRKREGIGRRELAIRQLENGDE